MSSYLETEDVNQSALQINTTNFKNFKESQAALRFSSVSYRWSWVRADVASFPPRQVQASDELQVEGMAGVQHGEAHDVGLIAHHVVQPEQREVLEEKRGRSYICGVFSVKYSPITGC